MKIISLLFGIAAIATGASAQWPASTSNHGTVQSAAQYSLPCYNTSGTTRILGGCLNIATDSSGDFIVTALVKTNGSGAGFTYCGQGSDASGNAVFAANMLLFECPSSVATQFVTIWPAAIGSAGQFLSISSIATCANSSFNCVTLGYANGNTVNAQTATYQVLASDFYGDKTIAVSSGSFTITLVASTSQPPNGQYIDVVNYGSGTVTIARSGQNINGQTSSIVLPPATGTSPNDAMIWSDGTNYEASLNIGQFAGNNYCVDSGGSAGTFVCAPNSAIPSTPNDGTIIVMKAAHASAASSTIAVSGAAAIALDRPSQSGYVTLGTSDMIANEGYVLRYDATAAIWVLLNSSATMMVSGAMTQYDLAYGNTGNLLAVTSKIKVDSSNQQMFATYNNETTAGVGTVYERGIALQTSETAAATVLTVTPASSAGMYRACIAIDPSAASSATLGWTMTWTDSNGTAQAPTNLALFANGTAAPALTFTAAVGTGLEGCQTINVNNAGTAINVKLTFSGTSFTAKVSASLERLD